MGILAATLLMILLTGLMPGALASSSFEAVVTSGTMKVYREKSPHDQIGSLPKGTVVTVNPIEHWRFKEQPQDPIGFESAWMAKSGKYLNVGLLMKTGRISDEELPHNIGLSQDTVYTYPDGRRAAYYRFLHNQNGIPQYYTNRRYVSILLPTVKPDTIHLSIQTYDGIVHKTL